MSGHPTQPPTTLAGGAATVFPCPRCLAPLAVGTLQCGACGALVYARRIDDLAREAAALEPVDPVRAAHVWRQGLDLIPPGHPSRPPVDRRVGALLAGYPPADPAAPPAGPTAPPRDDPLWLALVKTVGSMVVSIVVYDALIPDFTLSMATGFVLLILVHELGHVAAIRRYGMRASPPVFIPFLGALINLREPPKNAWQEAVVGIGGPLLGTVGALACYAAFLGLHDPAASRFTPGEQWARTFLFLAVFGFVLNLFNMIPLPPLDGGRITAGVSVWAWVLGLIAYVGLVVFLYRASGQISALMVLIFFLTLPRVVATLRRRERASPYYQTPVRGRVWMGVAYIALTVFLLVMFVYSQERQLAPLGGRRIVPW